MFSSLISKTILSPNYNVRKNAWYNPTGKILKITPHHAAFVGTATQVANCFSSTARQASCNYAIGNDGEIIGVVDEENRAWTSSSPENDYLAVTIEVSNSVSGEPWTVSDAAFNSLIKLCVDICERNDISSLNFTGDASGNLTAHRFFASTACPGTYLYSKFPEIVEKVNKILNNESEEEEMTATEKAYVEGLEKRIKELEERTEVKYAWLEGKKDLVPDWAFKDIQYLYNKRFLKGTETGSLALSYMELRVLCVISRIAQKIWNGN